MIATIPGFGSFNYNEKVPGSPVYMFTNASSRVERTYTCAWANRIGLVQFLLGYPKIINLFGSTWVARYTPDAILDATVPGNKGSWLYASNVTRMVGSGETGLYDATGVAIYQDAVVTVAYESRSYNILEDSDVLNILGVPDESEMLRYVTRMQKPSAEFIQLPKGCMHWCDGIKNSKNNQNQPVEYATARLVASTEFALTWHEAPFIPAAATTFVGCLNKFPFQMVSQDAITINQTFTPGTLLLLSSEIKPYRTGAGVFVQDITYRIKYMEPQPGRGFNFFLRNDSTAGTLIYEKITSDGNNDTAAIVPDGITLSPYNPGVYVPPPGSPAVPDRRVPLGAGTSRALYAYAGYSSLFKLNVDPNDAIVGQ